jgi:hypothetical protein
LDATAVRSIGVDCGLNGLARAFFFLFFLNY